MLSLRLCRDAFFDGVDDDDDVNAVVASSDDTAAVVSSSPGVVGVDVEPGPACNQTFFLLVFFPDYQPVTIIGLSQADQVRLFFSKKKIPSALTPKKFRMQVLLKKLSRTRN